MEKMSSKGTASQAMEGNSSVEFLASPVQDQFEEHVAKLAPEATLAAFNASVQNGGAVIVEGNHIVRVTPSGQEILGTIESPFSGRKNTPGRRLRFR